MVVLGIETSCDETGLALYDSAHGLLCHNLYSQIELHNQYGGVVPEIAARDHVARIGQMFLALLAQANLSIEAIDAIAYTKGPGLIGSLLVGATFAHGLGYARNIPVLGVHHLEGHLLAPMLEEVHPEFPHLALLVSGGHTLLILIKSHGNYKILGESIDDAAGEAFDKVAKLLGLNYPGGPEIAKLAKSGDPAKYKFPRPLSTEPNLNFSFSGLKTSVRNMVNKLKLADEELTLQTKADLAASFEAAVVDALCIKVKRACEMTQLNLVVAGGVGANLSLRARLQAIALEYNMQVFFPRIEFCTDNAAMIAYAGYLRLARGECEDVLNIDVLPRWRLEELV